MDLVIPLVLFVALLLAGVPVAWTMAAAGAVGILMITGSTRTLLGALETIPYGEGTSFSLITIPLFVLLAYVVQHSRLSDDLFDAFAAWMGRLPGGLAVASVFSGAMFGAMSGTSVASATVMSRMAVPPMDRHGYSRALSTGAVAAGSTLSTLIPPSVVLIVYGISTETSVGRLLMAGLVPGVLMAVALAVVIVVAVLVRPSLAPRGATSTWRERGASLVKVLPVVGLLAVLMTLLYSGLVSPTEVAGVGALLAIALGVVLRRLTWKGFTESLTQTVRITVMIFALFIGAGLFGQFLTLARVPQQVVGWVGDLGLEPMGVLLLVALIYVVGCMFVDEMPFLLLTLPVTFPLMIGAGFDPVWYGVFAVMLLNIGLIAPPIGIVTFIVAGVTKTRLATAYQGAGIMLVAVVACIAACVAWPELVLWLPDLMR